MFQVQTAFGSQQPIGKLNKNSNTVPYTFSFSFIFCELIEKVMSVFNRHNIRKQESFLATRKLESQFLEQEIFSLPKMSEYHSPLGIPFQ
jgi:hypothetical protein